MPTSLRSNGLQGKLVYSPDGKTLIGEVDYLRYDPLGREIIRWIEATFRGNQYLQTDAPKEYYEGAPILGGTILFEGAVSSALDALGITDVHTAYPEQVIAVMRLKDFENARKTENDFGVIIAGNIHNIDAVRRREAFDTNMPYASHLVRQAGILEDMLPVAMFQLRSVPDNSYYSEIRLDYIEGKSFWIPAPGFRKTTDEVPEYFKTSKYQSIEVILNGGQTLVYRSPYTSPYPLAVADSNKLIVEKPLDKTGLSALVRIGTKRLDTDDNLNHYLWVDRRGRVLLAVND